MTKPEDIPQWAWEKAEKVQKALNAEVSSDLICSLYDAEEQDTRQIAEAILSAVEEEREACAKMVSDWGHKAAPASDGWGTKIMEPVDVRALASAIRNRKES